MDRNTYRKSVTKLNLMSTFMIALLVLIDQLTKLLAANSLMGTEGKPLIPGVLELLYIENTGAAFSFMTGQTWFFIVVTPIIVAIIAYFFLKLPFYRNFLPLKMSLIFLMAGAIGNFIDRIILGYVIDFIYFSIIDFPVFNVADIFVTLSLIFIILLLLFKYKNNDFDSIFKKKNKADNQ